jgi:hypothetical protein
MPGDDRADGALAVAREAARALGAEGLSGASPMPAALPPRRRFPSLAFVTSDAGCQTPLTSRLPHAAADPERAWLETTTLDLRRLVPGESAGARDSLSIDAGDDDDDVDVAFVEAVMPHRPKQNVPSTASTTPSALPPLPALPIGSRLLPIAELVAWRSKRGTPCCASDLRALWSGARAAARAAEARECQKENQNEETFADAAKGGAVPATRADIETILSALSARETALAPVVPFAIVGRLRLARAARPNDEDDDDDEDDSGTGLLLEDATGRVAVASVDLPDARLLGKRVLCVAWTLLIDGEGHASRRTKTKTKTKTALLEVARFAPLDAPSVVADPLPAMTSAAVPAPPAPKRGSGFAVRGAVVAVSPVVSLRVPREGGAVSPDAETNRLGEAPETIRHRFFLVELGDACASCGGNGGGTGTGTPPTRDPSDRSEPLSWRRRLVFTGDALARWHPFFGAATGGGGAEVTCGCVEVTNLRASRLFKGEGDRRELRVAAATAATTVAVGRPTVAARETHVDRDAGIASGGCACASCARGDTVSFLDAYVLGEDPSGLGVRVSGRRDGRGVPFLLTHARVGSPPRGGVAFPALRPGTLVRVTHAHPVWRRRAEVRGGDDDDSDDSDDASSDDAEPLKKTPERRVEDETDHFGCRALGACVRTRVRVLRRSPLAASVPRLFAADLSRSRHDETFVADSGASLSSRRRFESFVSARAMQRHCETRSFVETARLRRLALALARRTKAWDDRDAREARAALAGLVLGKRKRARQGGEDAEADEGERETHREGDSAAAADRERERFLDALAACFTSGEEGDPSSLEASNTPKSVESQSVESARASIYHEFFTPTGYGGHEARLPRLPAVAAVTRLASRAFAEARTSAAKKKHTDETDRNERSREEKESRRIPFGASVGAARCDRLVLLGEALFTTPVALVGWLARRNRRDENENKGAPSSALYLSDVPIPPASRTESAALRRGARGFLTNRVHVEIESGSVLVPETLPLGGLVVVKRWSVFCEGASPCVADDDFHFGREEPSRKTNAPCRVHVRARREDVIVIGDAARGGVLGEQIFRLAPPPPAKCGVSDVLVWRPDRSNRRIVDGDARLSESGPGGVPVSLALARKSAPSTEVRQKSHPRNLAKWPPAPWFPPPFLARVTRDERVLDDRGGERKLRLTFADVSNEGDVVDAYVGGMDPSRVPLGIGAGAVVLVERAAAHVSANANVYLKLTSQTVLRVLSPAASTFEVAYDTFSAPRLFTQPLHVRRLMTTSTERACGRRFASLDALARGAREGFEHSCVDRRAWTTRARVARVSFLCAKWACLSCGCDAGSFGAANAVGAMRLVAERRAERERRLREGEEKLDVGPNAAPSSVAGCSMCRPPAERFIDDAALNRAVDAACGFEVEVGAVLTNGEASADAWVAGDAGRNLLPPAVRAATKTLAKKHGRVVARFDAAAANAGAFCPYVMEGYCGQTLGEVESGPLLAAIGHAASLGEVLATVEYKYVAFSGGDGDCFGNFAGVGALSAPGPTTRVMSLGGVPVATKVAPTAKLRVTALEPVEPAREAARMLAEEAPRAKA